MTKQDTWNAMTMIPVSERNCHNCAYIYDDTRTCEKCNKICREEWGSKTEYIAQCKGSLWKLEKYKNEF